MSLGSRAATFRRARLAALLASALTPALAMTPSPASADEVLTPLTAITLPGGPLNSFDISFVDPSIGIYVLGDRSHKAIDVVDTHSNQLIMQIGAGVFTGATGNNNTSGPDGVLIVGHSQVWAGDGDSTVKIFSLLNGAQVATVSTGGANRVDEMCFDPTHNIVAAANNAESPFPFITFFALRSHAILKKIVFDGTNGTPIASNGIEQCQFNSRTGKFYVSVPEINGPGDNSVPGGVSVIDPVTLSVVTTYTVPLSSCSGPQGLAIGPAPQMLLGCNGGPNQAANGFPTAIINDGSTGGTAGSVFATLPNQSGGDMVDYNSASDTYVLARSAANPPPPNGTASCTGTITAGPQLLGVVDATAVTPDTSITSGLFNCPAPNNHGNNHSVASDSVTNQWFVPIAGNSGSTLCGSVGGSNTSGCILVMTQTGTTASASSDTSVAQGAPACRPGATLRRDGACR